MAQYPTSAATDNDLSIAVNNLKTLLTDNPLSDSATTVNVADTTGFPSVGYITIDAEVIRYVGTTATSFTGCVRGSDGTTNVSHAVGLDVRLDVIAQHHNGLKDEIMAVEADLYAAYASDVVPTAAAATATNFVSRIAQILNQIKTGFGLTNWYDAVTAVVYNLADLLDVSLSTPSVGQILTYNGAEWINGNPVPSSAGNGIEFFMDETVVTATGTNNDFEISSLLRTPVGGAEVADAVVCNANTVLSEAHIYNQALNRTTIEGGVWDFDTWAGVSSATGVSQLLINMCRVRIVSGTTVTVTGSGTSRTVTASGGTYFNTSDIDASATVDVASYVQTPHGIYQITARTNDTTVTITTPSTYANETTVSFSVWKRLFQVTTGEINDVTPAYGLFNSLSVQPAFTILATDTIGELVFGTTTSVVNKTITHVHNGTSHYSHVATPLSTLHNELSGLQGGTGNEYYHLTSAQRTQVALLPTKLLTGDGSNTDPSHSFASDPDTGVYRTGTNSIGIAAGGVKKVDIGTTSMTVGVQSKLDSGTPGAPGISFNGDDTTGLHLPSVGTIGIAVGGVNVVSATSAGYVTQPLQPSFLATDNASTADVTGDGTDVTHAWATEVYDLGANFASNTFTAPVDGKYLLTASVSLLNILVTHTVRRLQIVTSRRTYAQTVNYLLAQTSFGQNMSVIADMHANDTATVHISVDGSTKTVDLESNVDKTFFSGSLIN